MEKKGFKRIPIEAEAYARLEEIAKERGITVQQLVDEICRRLMENLKKRLGD